MQWHRSGTESARRVARALFIYAGGSRSLPAISAMQPTLIREPVHRDRWVSEEKYDGWRMLAYNTGEHVRLNRTRFLGTRSWLG